MTSRKKTVPWLKTLRVLAAVIFSLSAAWTAFYYFNEHRSQSSLDSLSEEMNLARIEAGVGERAVPSSLAAAETPLPPAPVPATTAASTDWHGVQASAITRVEESPAPGNKASELPQSSQDAESALKTFSPYPKTPEADLDAEQPAAPEAYDALSAYYASLKDRNPDFGGWIHINNTLVDYPVMYTPDELEKYLHRNFEGQYSFAGVPFLDIAYPPSSRKVNQIIYAHNMKSGQMFATLNEYLKDDFWAEYRKLSFNTIDTRRDYEVLALIPLVLGPMDDPKMMIFHPLTTDNEQSVAEINAYLRAYSRRLDGEVQLGDDLLTLVTCRHARDSDRLILVTRKIDRVH